MIETIHLKNFKCLEDTKKLDLKPLTILCGTNSCGKSSIIQSILMLKQTFESQSRYKNIVLNGQFAHLGQFEDFVFQKKPENEVQISFELNFDKKSFNNVFSHNYRYFKFGKERYNNLKKLLLEIDIGLKTSEDSNDKGPYVDNFEIKAKSLSNSNNYLNGTEIKFERKENKEYFIKWKNTIPFPFEAPNIKPPKDVANYQCPICKSKHRANSKIGKEHYTYYSYFKHCSGSSCSLKASFINLIPELEMESDGKSLTRSFNHLERPLFSVRHILQNEFNNLFYIGPLREEPSRRYISEEEYINIGNRGQNAPFILSAERDNKIFPYYFFDPSNEKWEEITEDTLGNGVNRWLSYMDISENCESKTDKEIIRLYLPTHTDKNVKVTLSDVGFGVSQILPILVEGLRIRPYQTLILEQPEIHLHPKLQMQLADFFISMILSGKNVLLETHSDHIINRIARRVIEDESNRIFPKTNILFFEQRHDGSVIDPVEIDPNRGVVNWPKGFFDQSAEEKKMILSKGIERRKKNR
ncbi:DUF3696 domain-containing protein [Methanosarcina sp. Mfa9]|uniref:DUF3696 domain-containing protein n=1 Tax=Methanosarcina sp. Mfa9 TaxID=3439063 RepID=UPI003F87953A